MRFGEYNLQKAAATATTPTSKGQRFGLKKVQNTANNIAGKFQLKFETLSNRFRPPCESPLSFQGSLFDSDFNSNRTLYKYTPDDFRPKFDDESTYVFATNLTNFAKRKQLTGKSTKIYSKLVSSGASTLDARNRKFSINTNSSQKSSLQRLKDERRCIFKELLELSSCDESLEYRLVKDYLESNSYSDIENDTDFKDYLKKKNYQDILDYLDRRSENLPLKNSRNLSKSLKSLYCPTEEEESSIICDKCKSEYSKSPSRPSTRIKNFMPQKNYEDIYNFCNNFFVESLKDNRNREKMHLPEYSEKAYRKLLKTYCSERGYTCIRKYVYDKFTQYLDKIDGVRDT